MGEAEEVMKGQGVELQLRKFYGSWNQVRSERCLG